MALFTFAIVVGFILLVLSADRFVHGAAGLARNYGLSPLVIGLTIVAFGTSAPEILVTGIAAWQGNTGLGVGNAIGSNIANVGMVIGATAILLPLSVQSDTMRREFPILFAIMLVALVLLVDGTLSVVDGAVLMGGMVVMTYWLVTLGKRSRVSDPIGNEYEEEIPRDMPTRKAVILLVVGLAVLLASSELVVWAAVGLAREFGVSDLVIGLTIIAIGTSLPELATSIISAVKKEHDIAIGNILGSNMFNLLAVLSLPGLMGPQAVESAVLTRDMPFMIILTLTLFAMSYGFGRTGTVGRLKGTILIGAFIAYQLNLYRGWI
ncbi:MAG: calcium/sodium antiporter [Acidiferrobacterales bacterium]|jgi:cation:H+ antiporter|nr:calcium/sodium antiporter [Acidiferrobacterales bacterium]